MRKPRTGPGLNSIAEGMLGIPPTREDRNRLLTEGDPVAHPTPPHRTTVFATIEVTLAKPTIISEE